VLHRQVAEAIERTFAGRSEYVTALAHHWQQANEPAREAVYAYQAGLLALESGAYREAIVHLGRTVELFQAEGAPAGVRPGGRRRGRTWRARLLDPNSGIDPESREFRLGRVEGALSEACFRLGDSAGTVEHGCRALRHWGERVPESTVGWGAEVVRQLALRAGQHLGRLRTTQDPSSRLVASDIGHVHMRLSELFIHSMRALPFVASILRAINHCEPAGPSADLAYGYIGVGLAAAFVPAPSLAARWMRHSVEIAEQAGTPRDVALMVSRTAVFHLGRCQWDAAEAALERVAQIAEEVGDIRRWEECPVLLGLGSLYQAQFERAIELFRRAHQLTRRTGDRQVECWSLIFQACALIFLGRHAEALPLLDEACEKVDQERLKLETVVAFGAAALARLRAGDERGAHDWATQSLSHILATSPILYGAQGGLAATAEVFLSLLETGGEMRPMLERPTHQAVMALRRFASHNLLARPYAELWGGLEAWLHGRRARALRLWRRAIAAGERLRTPYEVARAHLEIGRHLDPGDPERERHLAEAAERFARLGCVVERERASVELSRTGSARPRHAASP